MHSHYPLLPSFLRQNSLDLTMESDAQTLLALHCLKGTKSIKQLVILERILDFIGYTCQAGMLALIHPHFPSLTRN